MDTDPDVLSVHWVTDPDPALFVNGFQDAKKKISLYFFCLLHTVGGTFTN
jgi:hypothetical protein